MLRFYLLLLVIFVTNDALPQSFASATKTFLVQAKNVPNKWPINQLMTIEFALFIADGQILAAADNTVQIEVSLTMPAHRHGSNIQPKVVNLEDNQYAISGLYLHMIGDWLLKLSLTSGNMVDEVRIPIETE